jgi:hypothetical protein
MIDRECAAEVRTQRFNFVCLLQHVCSLHLHHIYKLAAHLHPSWMSAETMRESECNWFRMDLGVKGGRQGPPRHVDIINGKQNERVCMTTTTLQRNMKEGTVS